jgi:hypothetical protein
MADTINCDPKTIAEASKCFCMSEPAFRASMLFLLLQISGLNLKPDELAQASRGYLGTPENVWRGEVTMLLCAIVNKP